jgi:hypothetical protein
MGKSEGGAAQQGLLPIFWVSYFFSGHFSGILDSEPTKPPPSRVGPIIATLKHPPLLEDEKMKDRKKRKKW